MQINMLHEVRLINHPVEESLIEIIELACSRNIGVAITHLNIFSEGADEEISMRILFGMCYEALKYGTADYSAVAKRLYFWSMYETDLTGFSEFYSFWDAFNLADGGIAGESVAVKKSMLNFLSNNKA